MNLTVITYYNPPGKTLNTAFLDTLDRHTLILGDLNAKHLDFGCNTQNRQGKHLLDFINDSNLTILNNNEPTRFDHYRNSNEILDLAIATPNLLNKLLSFKIDDSIPSDHRALVLDFGIDRTPPPPPAQFRNIKKLIGQNSKLI